MIRILKRYTLICFLTTAGLVIGYSRLTVAQTQSSSSAAERGPIPAPDLPVPAPVESPVPDTNEVEFDRADLSQDTNAGYRALLQGPVHEAFATPTDLQGVGDARVIAQAPPDPVSEIPPEPPSGQNGMQWIPGYWSWSDDTSEYIWVSGMWRRNPPGRAWHPGYWSKAAESYRWTPGYWQRVTNSPLTANYLPQPPDSIDNGPSVPPPGDDYFWVPGHWAYGGQDYQWQSGYWAARPSDWIWQPACYLGTPHGHLFVGGYWDYLPPDRGLLYAPIGFYDPVYRSPNFVYRPRQPLANAASLLLHLFVRQGYPHYYYGDYWGPFHASRGYRPWYDYGFRNWHLVPWLGFYDWKYRKFGLDFVRSMNRYRHGSRANSKHSSVSKQDRTPADISRNAFSSAKKNPKSGRTFDQVVRSEAGRVDVAQNQKQLGGDLRRGTGVAKAGQPSSIGRSGVKEKIRSAPPNMKRAESSSPGSFKPSSPSNGRRAQAAYDGGGLKQRPGLSNSSSIRSTQSFGRQESPSYKRGGGSSSSFRGSKSSGKSKSSGGGSRGRGKGKK